MGKKTRIRKAAKATPETAEQATKREEMEAQARIELVGKGVGLPSIQRDPQRVKIVDAIGDGWQHSKGSTLQRLSKAERLHQRGVIDATQVAAIKLYVDAHEAAYGSCLGSSGYGEGGGSSPTGAASAAHSRQLDRIGADWRYRRARASLPPSHVAVFERIVLAGDGLIEAGGDIDPNQDKKPDQSTKYRRSVALLIECANLLCAEFAAELRIVDSPLVRLVQGMVRMQEYVTATTATSAAQTPVTDAINEQMLSLDLGDPIGLSVSSLVMADLMRENALEDVPDMWGGCPVVVIDHWNWGWIVGRRMVG